MDVMGIHPIEKKLMVAREEDRGSPKSVGFWESCMSVQYLASIHVVKVDRLWRWSGPKWFKTAKVMQVQCVM